MKNLTIILTIFGFLILTVSCEQPKCKNTNLIFDKYSPYTKQYKDELVKQLINIDKSKLTYWMDEYQEIDNSQNICANIQGVPRSFLLSGDQIKEFKEFLMPRVKDTVVLNSKT